MFINSNHTPNFTSRSVEIRLADDIARKVNAVFPRLSSTKYEGLEHSKEFAPNISNLFNKIFSMRRKITKITPPSDMPSRWKLFADIVKESKLGNCHESAMLGEIAARVNGIRNCRLMEVCPKGADLGDTLDHVVLLVEGRAPYIIDPWLGFADYVPNTIKRFQKEYQNHFDFKKYKSDEIELFTMGFKNSLNYQMQEKLKTLFPELIIRK